MVVLQSHHWKALATTLVALMFARVDYPPDELVVLSVAHEGGAFSLDVALLANVETGALKNAAGSLEGRHDDISRAVQRLFTGF